MFYCDECRDKNEWPDTWAKSEGKCELCGKQAVCNDRPSGRLPPTKPKAESK